MKVFISYGSIEDQVTALRLQALAAVNGLSVFVPPVHTRQQPAIVLAPENSQQLAQCDIVLGVVGTGLTQACSLEMNTAVTLRKSLIVVCNPQFEASLRPAFGANLVVINSENPAQTENAIVSHLTALDQSKKTALLALGTLTLGLLIFGVAQK